MSDDHSGGWSIPWTAIFAIVLAAGGAFFINSQLTSSRPTAERDEPADAQGHQDVSARLWQDPFKAAEEHRDAHRGEKGDK